MKKHIPYQVKTKPSIFCLTPKDRHNAQVMYFANSDQSNCSPYVLLYH